MLLHDIGEYIPVFRPREALDRCHARKGLEPELGNIAEEELPVC